jgi:hypothetical protein
MLITGELRNSIMIAGRKDNLAKFSFRNFGDDSVSSSDKTQRGKHSDQKLKINLRNETILSGFITIRFSFSYQK